LPTGVANVVALRGDNVPLSSSQSPLVIEEFSNQLREFTSSVIVEVEEELLIFIGTEVGTLLKVVRKLNSKLCL